MGHPELVDVCAVDPNTLVIKKNFYFSYVEESHQISINHGFPFTWILSLSSALFG